MKSSNPGSSAAALASGARSPRAAPWVPPLLICALYWLQHVFTAARYLTNWDAGQFALGTVRFDLASHQPHPPGYFLFMTVGRWLNAFTEDANTSLVVISGLAGLATVLTFYWAALELSEPHTTGGSGHETEKKYHFLTQNAQIKGYQRKPVVRGENQRTAIWLTLLLVANPVLWYYGSIANTYTFEALAIIATALLTVRTMKDHQPAHLVLNVAVLSLLAGFRPTVVLASAPLLFVQLFSIRQKITAIAGSAAVGMLALSLWVIPLAQAAGGWPRLVSALANQALVAGRTTVYDLNQFAFLGASLLFTCNISLLLAAAYCKPIAQFVRRRRWFLLLPVGLMLGVFLVWHFGEVGYLLSILPFGLLFLSPAVHQMTANRAGAMILAAAITLNGALFFIPPQWIPQHKLDRINYHAIREHDARIAAYLSAVRQYSPGEVVVVVLRGQYYQPDKTVGSYSSDDIRALEYYLPDYQLYDLLGVRGLYFTAADWRYQKQESDRIPLGRNVKTLLVLAEYLHPDVWPLDLALQAATAAPSLQNVYRASITGIDRFPFLGFTFIREP